MRKLFAAAGALALLAASAAAAAPPPVEAFGRIPAVIDASISPNGQHVALLGGDAEARSVSIATIDQPGLPAINLGAVEAIGLRWSGDEHVLVRVAQWKAMTAKQAYRFERNIAVDLQGRVSSILLERDPHSIYLVEQPVLGVTANPARAFVLGLMLSNDSDTNLGSHLDQKSAESAFIPTLFSVDPATGATAVVEGGSYDTVSWALDEQGTPRIRLDLDHKRRRFTVMQRSAAGQRYAPLWSSDFQGMQAFYGYAAGDGAVYLGEGGRLVRLKLDGAREPVGPALDHANPTLIWDPAGRKLVGVRTGVDSARFDWLDPSLAPVHASLSKAFKGRRVDLVDWSAESGRYVLRVTGHDAPPAWYLFDRPKRELSPLGEEYPELKGASLGATRWVAFKARDGLEMGAYLTLPPGLAAGARPPLIVLPHGGPAARDDEEFDFLVQFLASRGYAVLRPQFRGSRGFGQAFEDAGRGEWAGKMQTDLLDAVAAAAAGGEIDASRACIVGASFGGYAALAAAAYHSDSYRCAVSIAGISNLGLLLNQQARAYGRESAALDSLRGDLGRSNLAQLDAASPVRSVKQVAIPLLLIHGDQDTVAAPEQSTVMAKAMTTAGKPVQLVLLKGENHYLTKPESRLQTLTTISDFLAKNLPTAP